MSSEKPSEPESGRTRATGQLPPRTDACTLPVPVSGEVAPGLGYKLMSTVVTTRVPGGS